MASLWAGKPDPKPERREKANREGWEVIRGGFADQVCIACGLGEQLELHHVTPRSQSGDDVPENLCCLCRSCHTKLEGHESGWERVAMAVRVYVLTDRDRCVYAIGKAGWERFSRRYPLFGDRWTMNDDQLRRFEEKVDREPAGCWIWTGSTDGRGYGTFMLDGRRRPERKPERAHRVAYEHWVGPIPDALELDHLCRHRICVNPAHLEPVTHRENSQRGLMGNLVTHCPQGHPYNETNTYVTPAGHRQCRACKVLPRTRSRRYVLRREGKGRSVVWVIWDSKLGNMVARHESRRPGQEHCNELNVEDRKLLLAALGVDPLLSEPGASSTSASDSRGDGTTPNAPGSESDWEHWEAPDERQSPWDIAYEPTHFTEDR